jgi:chromate transporter
MDMTGSRPTVLNPTRRELFVSFFRLGLSAFGGPSMVAYIRKMVVEKKRWLDARQMDDGIALSQIIPGATSMQTAAFVGLMIQGVTGALFCFIGFALPAFILMMILSALYLHAHDLPAVAATFSGLSAIIVAIVAKATVIFAKVNLKEWRTFAIASMATALFMLKVHPLLAILISALIGTTLLKSQLIAKSHARVSFGHSYRKPLLLIGSLVVTAFLVLFLVDKTLFNLAALMFRIDLFAFGGGYASVPFMLHEIVHVYHWLDQQTFMNGIIMGQITPGPIVITATFVGYMLAGLWGGLVSTVAVFTPSFLLLVGLVPYYDQLRSRPFFSRIITGVLCSFTGLLFAVTLNFAMTVHWDWAHTLLAVAAFIALLYDVDILWVVLLGTGLWIVKLVVW